MGHYTGLKLVCIVMNPKQIEEIRNEDGGWPDYVSREFHLLDCVHTIDEHGLWTISGSLKNYNDEITEFVVDLVENMDIELISLETTCCENQTELGCNCTWIASDLISFKIPETRWVNKAAYNANEKKSVIPEDTRI